MSVKDEQTKNLEEEVVVEVNEATEVEVLDKEAKKAEIIALAKKVLKVAGVVAVGVVGFVLGSKSGNNSDCNDSENMDVDFEIEKSDE